MRSPSGRIEGPFSNVPFLAVGQPWGRGFIALDCAVEPIPLQRHAARMNNSPPLVPQPVRSLEMGACPWAVPCPINMLLVVARVGTGAQPAHFGSRVGRKGAQTLRPRRVISFDDMLSAAY